LNTIFNILVLSAINKEKDINNKLFYACGYNLNAVKYFISQGATSYTKIACITFAAKKGKLDIIKYLISIGLDIKIYGSYIISAASNEGNINIIKYIFSQGINANDIDNFYASFGAINHNHTAVIKYLHSKGVKFTEDEFSECVEMGNLEAVKFLANQGINIKANNDVAIYYSISKGTIDVFDYLISRGLTVDDHYDDMMEISIKKGYLNVLKHISRYGDIKKYGNNYTSLAISNNNLEILKYLEHQGVDIYANGNYAIREAAGTNNLEILKYLMKKEATIENINFAIQNAAKKGHLEIVKFLITKGADIKSCNFSKNYYIKLIHKIKKID